MIFLNKNAKMNNFVLIGILIVVVVAAGFFFYQNSSGPKNSSVNQTSSQNVVLSYKNYNYYPNTIRVKVGEPVSISLDSSVSGCYRSFTIRELGISKYLATPLDKLTFTPEKAGTYRFACSMGMGYGTLIVE